MGILKILGTISLDQFWPTGASDADTTKVKVNITQNSFFYSPNNDGQYQLTSAFFGAKYKGQGSELVIKNDKITIRLQGIDAPELHYKAAPLPRNTVSDEVRTQFNSLNKERRQYWAESASVALHDFLETMGSPTLGCEIYSVVDFPHEVIDTYGRFVANIKIPHNGNLVDINLWLAEQGWVFPTFYSSMSELEIKELLTATQKGKNKQRVWKDYSNNASLFNNNLLYREDVEDFVMGSDKGKVLLPKLYRRQVSWQMRKQTGVTTASFAKYLSESPDEIFLTDDFLNIGLHAATTHKLHEFMKNNRLQLKPEDMVFKEKASTLVDANGKKVVSW